MTLHERIVRLAHALGADPCGKVALEPSSVTGSRKWWLVGCRGGDIALPMTEHAHTILEALEAAEGWLGPELVALEGKP